MVLVSGVLKTLLCIAGLFAGNGLRRAAARLSHAGLI
jgi:hypothetical protein